MTDTHKSRLGAVVIDCRTDDLDAAAEFWATALGGTVEPVHPDALNYRVIGGGGAEPKLILQQVDHEPRVHLDIETDNKDAEYDRLVAAGAREVARVKTWIVMEAPTGHRFCIINPQGPGLAEHGTTWPGDQN